MTLIIPGGRSTLLNPREPQRIRLEIRCSKVSAHVPFVLIYISYYGTWTRTEKVGFAKNKKTKSGRSSCSDVGKKPWRPRKCGQGWIQRECRPRPRHDFPFLRHRVCILSRRDKKSRIRIVENKSITKIVSIEYNRLSEWSLRAVLKTRATHEKSKRDALCAALRILPFLRPGGRVPVWRDTGDRGRVYDFHGTGPHAGGPRRCRARRRCRFFRPRTKRVRVSDVPGRHGRGGRRGASAGRRRRRVRPSGLRRVRRLSYQDRMRRGGRPVAARSPTAARHDGRDRRARLGRAGPRVGGRPRTMKAARSASRRTRAPWAARYRRRRSSRRTPLARDVVACDDGAWILFLFFFYFLVLSLERSVTDVFPRVRRIRLLDGVRLNRRYCVRLIQRVSRDVTVHRCSIAKFNRRPCQTI